MPMRNQSCVIRIAYRTSRSLTASAFRAKFLHGLYSEKRAQALLVLTSGYSEMLPPNGLNDKVDMRNNCFDIPSVE